MQINTKAIKKRFQNSMNEYNDNAIVQINLAENLIQELLKFNDNFNIITEFGAGTGILTEKIAENLKFNEYYGNDLIEKSKNYINKIIPQAKFICGNACKVTLPKKADLIISNAMFQWFTNIEDIITQCKKDLNSKGILAFTTFGKNNFKEIKEVSGLTLNYKSMSEILSVLEKDFDILYANEYSETLKFNTPLELLLHLKNTGVNSLSEKPWSIKDIKDFCQKYLQTFDRVELTYNPMIFIVKAK